jgi:hypothetical protein
VESRRKERHRKRRGGGGYPARRRRRPWRGGGRSGAKQVVTMTRGLRIGENRIHRRGVRSQIKVARAHGLGWVGYMLHTQACSACAKSDPGMNATQGIHLFLSPSPRTNASDPSRPGRLLVCFSAAPAGLSLPFFQALFSCHPSRGPCSATNRLKIELA